MAMKMSSGLPIRPRKPKTKASAWPIRAAMLVACVRGSQIASTARSTRPPSIGKAGIRLKSTRKTFTEASLAMKLSAGLSRRCRASMSKREFMNKISTTAMTTFTAGPASATTISCPGFSGMRSSRARPPIGSSVMSGVLMP